MPLNNVGMGQVGEGNKFIPAYAYESVSGGGTWREIMDANQIHNYYQIQANGGSADGDAISFNVYLGAGTYKLQLLYEKNTDQGILDIDVDGVEVGSQDTYAAAVARNQLLTIAGISIAISGLKTVTLRIDGKNGAAGAHYMRITAFSMWRTS